MEIKKFGVVGAGQMGNGIVQVAAMSGLDVVMNDINDEFVQRGLKTITKFFDKGIEKGKLTQEQKDQVLGRIQPSTDINDMADVDFVVEAPRGAWPTSCYPDYPLDGEEIVDYVEACSAGEFDAYLANFVQLPAGTGTDA